MLTVLTFQTHGVKQGSLLPATQRSLISRKIKDDLPERNSTSILIKTPDASALRSMSMANVFPTWC